MWSPSIYPPTRSALTHTTALESARPSTLQGPFGREGVREAEGEQASDVGTKASFNLEVILDSTSFPQCNSAPAVNTAFNPYDLCEPWRLFQSVVGKFVGNVPGGSVQPPIFTNKLERSHELNSDCAGAEIFVKQTPKGLFRKAFHNSDMRLAHLKTMATGSNHSACGGVCGEVSNG